jgi:hypothetical protein
LGDRGDDLRVVRGCTLELEFGFLAETHEEAPLGLGSEVGEVVLLLELVEEVLELLHPVLLDVLQSLVEVVLDEETAVRTVPCLRVVIGVLGIDIDVVDFEGVAFRVASSRVLYLDLRMEELGLGRCYFKVLLSLCVVGSLNFEIRFRIGILLIVLLLEAYLGSQFGNPLVLD